MMAPVKLTPLFHEAIKLALRAHNKQVDKLGNPYIFHILRVVCDPLLTTEDEFVVAALHDILEDTNINTIHKLLHEIPALQTRRDILDALDIITRKPLQNYFEYIRLLKTNDIARNVKLADINDHLKPPLPNKALISRYESARCIILLDRNGANNQ